MIVKNREGREKQPERVQKEASAVVKQQNKWLLNVQISRDEPEKKEKQVRLDTDEPAAKSLTLRVRVFL